MRTPLAQQAIGERISDLIMKVNEKVQVNLQLSSQE